MLLTHLYCHFAVKWARALLKKFALVRSVLAKFRAKSAIGRMLSSLRAQPIKDGPQRKNDVFMHSKLVLSFECGQNSRLMYVLVCMETEYANVYSSRALSFTQAASMARDVIRT